MTKIRRIINIYKKLITKVLRRRIKIYKKTDDKNNKKIKIYSSRYFVNLGNEETNGLLL